MKAISNSFILALVVITTSFTSAWAGEQLSIQVLNGQLRDKPGYLGKQTSTLPYGDTVEVKAEEGDWRRVTSIKQGKSGWMHSSALSEQEIILRPTNRDVHRAQSGEIILSGQGFNQRTEEKYIEYSKANYAPANRMMESKILPTEVDDFIKAGGLGKGGAR